MSGTAFEKSLPPDAPSWARPQPPAFHLQDALHPQHMAPSLLLSESIRLGCRFHRSASWATAVASLPDADRYDFHALHDGEAAVRSGDGHVVFVSLVDGRAFVHVAAATREAIVSELRAIRAELPELEPDPEAPQVPITFWSLGEHGPVARTRVIDVPEWRTIAPHYVQATAEPLAALMGASFAPGYGGQLALWHGKPGTGKTYALRALAWEWRKWCDVHYVTDPEVFFGERAAYMLDVLLHERDEPLDVSRTDDDDPRAAGGRWRLLLLEDTGELMAADARARSGQGLSRLLNVVDGLIGQGLRVLALVTTNEEVKSLHPAVARPGRCFADIAFHALPADDAQRWLEDRGHPPYALPSSTTAITIADLFAIHEERQTSKDRDRVPAGFAR